MADKIILAKMPNHRVNHYLTLCFMNLRKYQNHPAQQVKGLAMNKNRQQILKASLRKHNEDIIELRRGQIDSAFRKAAVMILSCSLAFFLFADLITRNPPLSELKSWVNRDLEYIDKALNPDKTILPRYNSFIQMRKAILAKGKTPFSEHETYEEFKAGFLNRHGAAIWRRFFMAATPYLFIFFCLFKPRNRPLRIDRKNKLIYTYSTFKRQFMATELDPDEPLRNATVLSAFNGIGQLDDEKEYIMLELYYYLPDEERQNTYWFMKRLDYGVFPRLADNQNDILVSAINEYLSSENRDSELDKILDKKYHTPWLKPKLYFMTLFPSLHYLWKTKVDKDIANFKQIAKKFPVDYVEYVEDCRHSILGTQKIYYKIK